MRFPVSMRSIALAITFMFTGLLAACGGSSTGSILIPSVTDCTVPANQTGNQCGPVAFNLGDASGDFVSYVVTVDQITLVRDDGVTVNALPAPVTVDLAQLVDFNALLGTAFVPSGTYTSLSVKLDYSSADIEAENASGSTIRLTPVSSDGSSVGTITQKINLGADNTITVQSGITSVATLDFDLAASNSIDFSATPPTVTVGTFLLATASAADITYSQASGKLTAVDTAGATYTVDVVPLFYTGTKTFGSLVVVTDSQTAFSVNGAGYTGSPGLQAVAGLPAGTATLAYGSMDPGKNRFEASEVYAGGSVPGATLDSVHGSVTARSGSLLTVRGVTFVRSSGSTLYHSIVTVTLGTQTVVRKAGEPTTPETTADVSVGQRVVVLGTLTNTDPTALAMDAGATATGYVQLAPSSVAGTVLSENAGTVTATLSEINRHPVSWFNFAGTGTSAAVDANPLNYEINSGSLDLTAIAVGDPAEFDGFVQSFGQAPPDFNAETIGNYTASGTRLMVSWRPNGTAAPFISQSTTALVLNLADPNLGPFAVLRRGGLMTDLTSLSASPSIKPPSGGTGLYAIRQNGVVTVYVSFAGWEADLQSRLNGSTVMIGLFGSGGYSATTNTYTATKLSANLK